MSAAFTPGTSLAGYRVESLIGRGAGRRLLGLGHVAAELLGRR